MATKNKGDRNPKEVAAKDPDEQRLQKRTKRSAAEDMAQQSEDRAFGH